MRAGTIAVGTTAALVLPFVFLGVVMGDTHDPVAIEPDAPRGDGAAVATFAVG